MYEINVKASFEAAHRVVDYPGKCNNLHGHSWLVEAFAEGKELDDLGMMIDFKQVKNLLRGILEEFDHSYLNDLAPFKSMNPTAENLARYIYERMESDPIFHGNGKLTMVRVWESPTACVNYRKD